MDGGVAVKGEEKEIKTETQLFELGNILIGHCNETLTPVMIDRLLAEIRLAVTEGPCSWAFKE